MNIISIHSLSLTNCGSIAESEDGVILIDKDLF